MTGHPLESRRGVSLNRGRHDGPSAWEGPSARRERHDGPSARREVVMTGRQCETQRQLEESVMTRRRLEGRPSRRRAVEFQTTGAPIQPVQNIKYLIVV